jgi:protein-disulfide isomerase
MVKKVRVQKGLVSPRKQGVSQQNILLIAGGLTLAAVVFVGLVVLLTQQNVGSAISLNDNPNYSGIPLGGQYPDAREIERASDVAETVTMGLNDDGVPYIGNLEAPIQIAELADFTCPHCAEYHPEMTRLIRDFGRSGEAVFLYYPFAAGTRAPYSENAARAAVCAGQQGGFWELHDELFRVQESDSISSFTASGLEDIANNIDLDGSEIRTCMSSNIADAALVATDRLSNETGANSTPTVLYRFRGEDNWRAFGSGGDIGGGQPYELVADLIREANSQETGTGG